jgi:hypothetical protein
LNIKTGTGTGKATAIKNPAPDAKADFLATLRGVKKNLILMDMSCLINKRKNARITGIAYKNLRRKKIRSILTIIGISLSAWVLVSLFGFNRGYENSLNRDIDTGLSDTANGKRMPYEAATLMLQGSQSLRYMPESTLDSLQADPAVDKLSPMLMQTAFDINKGEEEAL